MIYVKKGALIKLVDESAAAKYTANGFTVIGAANAEKPAEKPKKPAKE